MAGQIEGKVAAVWNEGERICFAVNRGKEHGVRKRVIFAFGIQPIVDPDSGDKLGDYAPYTGWVVDVRPLVSICLLERHRWPTVTPEDIGLVTGTDVRTLDSGDIMTKDGDHSIFVP